MPGQIWRVEEFCHTVTVCYNPPLQFLSAVKQKERKAWYFNILNYANDSSYLWELEYVFFFLLLSIKAYRLAESDSWP